MGHGTLGPIMVAAVALLAATVIAIPLFRRLGLGSVLGYFAAGVAIGPFGLKLFDDPEGMLQVSELGVVMFLFIIGLEMRPTRLWEMRRQILGLGLGQVSLCALLLMLVAMAFGFAPLPAFVAGAGFVLSSTAVVMSVLQDRGEIATPEGQRAVAVLLLEDIMIVPLLAFVAFFAPVSAAPESAALSVALAVGAVALLLAAGRWLLDPMFSLLARADSREAMGAGALLVVLGAALLMEVTGLSMAMGAFLAGVLLSGSSYRHQIEADIEPFRGILMGLFFLSVGMSLDLGLVAGAAAGVAVLLLAFMVVKAAGVYLVARLGGSQRRAAVRRAAIFAQGGEFAFVLYAAARGANIFDAETDALFSAVVILSMAITPLLLVAVNRLMPPETQSMDGIDLAEDLHGHTLVIGFGRFGQMASQGLMARDVPVSIIDTDIEMIRAAEQLGFKVYYGDGTRLDILHASGADEAELILVCVDDHETTLRIVELAQAQFPDAKLLVRAFDRRTTLALRKLDVAFEVRETMGSALEMARQSLLEIGLSKAEADAAIDEILRRDRKRTAIQMAGGSFLDSRSLLYNNVVDSFRRR